MKQITCPHCGDTYPDFDVAHVCSKGPYSPRLKPKMNERIKLLAEQAETKEIGYYFFDREKFAELIIREYSYDCMDVTGNSEYIQFVAKTWGVEL